MLMTEQKLAVQVAQVDSVKVDDVNLAEAGQDEILEEFTAYASSADH